MNSRITRSHRPELRLLPLLGFCMMLLGPIPAGAVQNIHSISWDPATILTKPSVSKVHVSFEARISALDRSRPAPSFSVALRSPGGSLETICRYQIYGPDPCTGCGDCRPIVGSTTVFDLGFTMTCDPFRRDVEIIGSANMTYTLPGGVMDAPIAVAQVPTTTSILEPFGIAILDESGGVAGETSPTEFGCANTESGANGSIGVYFDPLGTVCQGTIPAGSVGTLWILARTAGATAAGIGAAQFRVTGLPASWQADTQPNPQIDISLGDPFGGGVVMGSFCDVPANGSVLLCKVLVTATRDEPDVRLEIGWHTPLVGPLQDCPLLVACDNPVFTMYCVDAASCFINPRTPAPCGKALAVERLTWSGVKGLYR